MFEEYLPKSIIRWIIKIINDEKWNLKRWNKAFYKGQELSNNGELRQSIEFFNIAGEYNIEKARIYLARGAAYHSLNQFKAAEYDYQNAIEENNELESAYYNLGILFSKNGNKDKAIEYYSKALNIYPGYLDALNNRGFVYTQKNQIKDAINDLSKAVKLYPKYAFAWNNLGFAKYKDGKIDTAIEYIDKSIQLNPENSYAHKNKAIILLELGKKKEAIELLLKSKALGFREMYGDEVENLLIKTGNQNDDFEINNHLIE